MRRLTWPRSDRICPSGTCSAATEQRSSGKRLGRPHTVFRLDAATGEVFGAVERASIKCEIGRQA